jgi:hypothetical protein
MSQNITGIIKHKYSINKKIHKLKNEQRIDTQQNTNSFYKWIGNLSNVTFTSLETQLLSKCLKYNLHHKLNNWIHTLPIEAYTAINQLNLRTNTEYTQDPMSRIGIESTMTVCERARTVRASDCMDTDGLMSILLYYTASVSSHYCTLFRIYLFPPNLYIV